VGGDWLDGAMAMYITAFDASGKEDDKATPFVVVAGFVSTAKVWEDFDRSWRTRLAEDHLPYFHMQAWHHWQASELFVDREHWNQIRIDKLMDDLLDIVVRHAFRKFCCVVRNQSYSELLAKSLVDEFRLNAYVLAARGAVELAHAWTLYRDNRPTEHVFEEGDKGKGMLLERMRIEGLPIPAFRWGKDTIHKKTGALLPGFTPLQAADIYAYETFLFAREFAAKRERSPVLRQLDAIAGEPRMFSVQNLQELKEMIGQIAADPDFWKRHRSL
jgi:hypothetical protein